jgi:hypothetical protein
MARQSAGSSLLNWSIPLLVTLGAALETMVVINAQGQIVARSASPIPPDQLVQLLRRAV